MTTATRTTIAELASLLRPSLLRLTRLVRNQRVDMSVTLTQLSAMGTLLKRGPMSAGELATCERVQPPSMTKVLANLEERGLVRREAHPTDRRQAIIAITDAGIDAARLRAPLPRRVAVPAARDADARRARAAAARHPDPRQAGRAAAVTELEPHSRPADPAVRTGMFRSLRVRNYRLYASGQLVSLTGTWMQRVAQDWLVLELTNSGTALGIVTALQFGPSLLLGLWGGVLADRCDKRRLLLVTQTAHRAASRWCSGCSTSPAWSQYWQVLVLATALGLITAIDTPGAAVVRRRDGRQAPISRTPSPSTPRSSTSAASSARPSPAS